MPANDVLAFGVSVAIAAHRTGAFVNVGAVAPVSFVSGLVRAEGYLPLSREVGGAREFGYAVV